MSGSTGFLNKGIYGSQYLSSVGPHIWAHMPFNVNAKTVSTKKQQEKHNQHREYLCQLEQMINPWTPH